VSDGADTPTKPPARPRAGAKPGAKSPRRRARELALQGLYPWLLARTEPREIEAQLREQDGFDKADRAHFDALLHGAIAEAAELDALLARHIDRSVAQLSPIEHGVLLIGAYELKHCIDVPYRVVINEAVELAKTFGGTDGHKYVNGVLDKAAAALRPAEVAAAPARRAPR
jgi:N utilization substance protein B